MTTVSDVFLQAIFADVSDPGPQQVYADWLDEEGRTDEAALMRRGLMLLDDADRMAAVALCGCRTAPGTATKRFIRLCVQLVADDAINELTVRQRRSLWSLVWNYRRQVAKTDRLFSQSGSSGEYLVRVAAWLLVKDNT